MLIDECESTNDLAKKMGEEGAPHGSWISARHQTNGRGRLGRVWTAESGNLYFSLIARVSDGYPITWIPLKAALATVQAVRRLKPGLDLKIKWPNDLVTFDVGGVRKAGGILCEGVGSRGGTFIVIGIGLNCRSAPQVDQPTTSLDLDVDALRPLLVEELLRELDASSSDERYLDHSLFSKGDPIEWIDLREPEKGVATGTFEGIGKLGELIAQTSEGRKPLYSEEVKLKIR